MRRLLTLCVCAALAIPASGQHPAEAWPEWRGGSAQGCAAVQHLPTRLDPGGPTMRWKAPVPGRGVSSPIVVGGRVFVTTAHRHESLLQQLRSIFVVALSALALLAGLVLAVRAARRHLRDARSDLPRPSVRWLLRLDSMVAAAATCAFAPLAIMATTAPDSLWTLGRPGEAWLVTGTILLLGLAAASGHASPGGRLRLLMTAAVLAVSALLWHGVPLDRYGIQYGALPRALMVAPAAVFACWSLGGRAFGSRSSGPAARADVALAGTGGVAVACAGLALFAGVNSQERNDRLARALLCFDLETGDQLWERVLAVAPKEMKWPLNSYATPTPCSDGERVFAYFGGGWGCVDLDGNVLWTGADPDYAPASRYGAGASPIVDGRQILLWQENEAKNRRSWFASFDIATGAVSWRVEPGDVHDSYSTPILVPRPNGRRELVTMAYRKLVAHGIEDGSRVWEIPLPARQVVPSLCLAGDDLLLVSGGTHLGFSTSAVRLRGAGTETRTEVIWQTRRNLSDICSPVVGKGLYFTLIDGRMRCIDPETGAVHWTGRVGAGDYWASLVAGDDKVYALSGDGRMTTVAMDASKFRILAESTFDEPCMATPALVEGRVVVRTEQYLYCFADPSDAQ